MKELYFRIRSYEQIEPVRESHLSCTLICPSYLFEKCRETLDTCRVICELPDILRENEAEQETELIHVLRQAEGVMIKNIDEAGLIKESGYTWDILADPFLYAYNAEAVRLYKGLFPGIMFVISDELTDHENEELWAHEPAIYKIYGRQRVMFTAQSFRDNFAATGRADDNAYMHMESSRHDRFIIAHEWPGYDTVLTEYPVSMIDRYAELKWDRIMVDLTTERAEEVQEVIAALSAEINGDDKPLGTESSPGKTIRGHHYKGID